MSSSLRAVQSRTPSGATTSRPSLHLVAVLANASEDIGTFLEIGCDPNFDETTLSYIETECKNPIFITLGIPCAREVTIEGYTPLILAVIYGTTKSVKKLREGFQKIYFFHGIFHGGVPFPPPPTI